MSVCPSVFSREPQPGTQGIGHGVHGHAVGVHLRPQLSDHDLVLESAALQLALGIAQLLLRGAGLGGSCV